MITMAAHRDANRPGGRPIGGERTSRQALRARNRSVFGTGYDAWSAAKWVERAVSSARAMRAAVRPGQCNVVPFPRSSST